MFGVFGRIDKGKSAAHGIFDESANLKLQLARVIEGDIDHHQKLKQQLETIVALYKKTEIGINVVIGELAKVTKTTQETITEAGKAKDDGNTKSHSDLTHKAENLVTRMIVLEEKFHTLKEIYLQSTHAVDLTKSSVKQSAMAIEKRLEEFKTAFPHVNLDEESVNALSQLTKKPGEEIPTFEHAQKRINQRYDAAINEGQVINLNELILND